MRKKRSFIRFNRFWGILFLMGLAVCFICIDVVNAYREFSQRAEQIRSAYIDSQKRIIKREVRRVADMIRYNQSRTENLTRQKIKTRVYEAHAIVHHIYQRYRDSEREGTVQQMALEALRPIRFEDGAGYYFATRFDGVELLFADRPGMEGLNLWDMQDTRGQYVIRDMVGIATHAGEGFYEYHWSKPGITGNDFKKVSFIKRFEPWEWFIGAGLYTDDIEAQIKEELLHEISKIRFGKEGYIFVNRLNGDALVSNGELYRGDQKLWEVFNDNPDKMKEIFDKEYRAASVPEGDFIQYTFIKLSDPRQRSEKISFVFGLPEFGWLIGAGVYLDDVETEIAQLQSDLDAQIKLKIIFFAVAVVIVGGLLFLFFNFLSDRLKRDIEIFLSFFKKAVVSDEPIDRKQIKFAEIDQIAAYANKMLADRTEAVNALRLSEAKYRRLTENSPDVIYRMSIPGGQYEYVSPASNTLFGYPPEVFYENPLLIKEILHPDWHDYFATEWQNLLDGIVSPTYEYQIVHKNRGVRWFNQRNVAVRNAQGALVAIEGIVTDFTDRKQAEEDLRTSQARFPKVLDSIDAAVYVADIKTHEVLFMNQHMKERFGRDMTGECCWRAFRNENGPCDDCTNDQLLDANGKPTGVYVWKDEDPLTGRHFVNHDRAIEWTDGRYVRLQIATDITQLTEMEAQLRQAQKMESVGRLAGGVAHDYNNMLNVILGYTELALEKLDAGNPLHDDLQEVHAAAVRSIDITRQLLAFSRKQTISPKRLDLNETVESMLKMLRRLLGEEIDLVWHPTSRLWPVMMDPSQVDQILVNLCVNARDAITGVGEITIETDTCHFDEAYCADHAGFQPGDFVVIAVSDNGRGMDKDVQASLFEPFFTTKAVGEGTGLGLATVYGIVKQNRGFIDVSSEPGQGSTFSLYLPRDASAAKPVALQTDVRKDVRGRETILLVEDEPAILMMTKVMLERLGYTVLEAAQPADAIDIARDHPGPIHLMVSDVVMPEMDGKALSAKLHDVHADLKVLFMSGYTADAIAHRGVLDQGVAFIQKPFSSTDLAAKVREVLDGQGRDV